MKRQRNAERAGEVAQSREAGRGDRACSLEMLCKPVTALRGEKCQRQVVRPALRKGGQVVASPGLRLKVCANPARDESAAEALCGMLCGHKNAGRHAAPNMHRALVRACLGGSGSPCDIVDGAACLPCKAQRQDEAD